MARESRGGKLKKEGWAGVMQVRLRADGCEFGPKEAFRRENDRTCAGSCRIGGLRPRFGLREGRSSASPSEIEEKSSYKKPYPRRAGVGLTAECGQRACRAAREAAHCVVRGSADTRCLDRGGGEVVGWWVGVGWQRAERPQSLS